MNVFYPHYPALLSRPPGVSMNSEALADVDVDTDTDADPDDLIGSLGPEVRRLCLNARTSVDVIVTMKTTVRVFDDDFMCVMCVWDATGVPDCTYVPLLLWLVSLQRL